MSGCAISANYDLMLHQYSDMSQTLLSATVEYRLKPEVIKDITSGKLNGKK